MILLGRLLNLLLEPIVGGPRPGALGVELGSKCAELGAGRTGLRLGGLELLECVGGDGATCIGARAGLLLPGSGILRLCLGIVRLLLGALERLLERLHLGCGLLCALGELGLQLVTLALELLLSLLELLVKVNLVQNVFILIHTVFWQAYSY